MLVKQLIERKSWLVKSAWIALIEKRNLERASAIHTTSTIEAKELERFEWRLRRVETIPNGVDEIARFAEDQVSPDVRQITAEQPLILFLGRISWKKGLDRLLNAFARTPRGKLAIVGPDDEDLVRRLADHAGDLGIAHRVRFLGRTVLGADKEFLYRSATVFVLPSYSENFGNTVLEAMQRGLPVVVTPEVGAAEIVRKSGGGMIVSGWPEPLSAAMSQLIGDPGPAWSMGEAGKLYVAQNYSWSRVARRMERLYGELVSFA
jgi:glycosyltransferase involved in cell wall biosynthesis